MTAPVVVFAVGNPSRGDDAIGPELCGRLEKWLKNEGLADQIELIEDFQLHELPPEAVLQVYLQTEGCEPPPSFVLCVSGEKFELGAPLTVTASSHVEAAFALLMQLCRKASLVGWRSMIVDKSSKFLWPYSG